MWPLALITWRDFIGTKANTRKPSLFTSGPLGFGKKPWGQTTRRWPPASTAWRVSTEPKADTGRPNRGLAIREKALGLEHPDVADSIDNLAQLYHTQGQYPRPTPFTGGHRWRSGKRRWARTTPTWELA
jgi:hypothetical protein